MSAAAAEAPLQAPPPGTSPWQRLYAAAHRLRGSWYRGRARRLPRPVVSIGNLHWGGTGKTPLVAAVARHLRRRGAAVCILSRGYGGSGSGVRLVSRGEGPLLDAATAGDEPVQLAGELPGVAVVVGPDRFRAGCEALARLQPAPDVFLLDDGFSHLTLRRDLDLLALPAADPFGGGRLWPGGRLREPLAAAARADAVLLTGGPAAADGAASPDGEPAAADGAAQPGGGPAEWRSWQAGGPATTKGSSAAGAALAAALRQHGFTGPGFVCPTRAGAALLLAAGGSTPLAAGSRVLLVSGIAHPERFAAAVATLDFAVMGELRFPDHHPFPPASLRRIVAAVRASGAAAALVTGKDGVKLLGRLDAPLAVLPVAAEPEPAFWEWFDRRLDLLAAGGPPP